MSRPNLTEQRRTLGALLRRPYEALQEAVFTEASESGFPHVRPSHSPIFRYISIDGSRPVDLARAAGMTKQSMAYLISDLEARGYLESIPDPEDGRAKLSILTKKGVAAQEYLIAKSAELEAEWAASIGKNEWAAFRQTLETLFDITSKQE